jgi:transposase
MRRHELTHQQFARLKPYLAKAGSKGGHPWSEHHRLLIGLFWKLHTAAQWRDSPQRYRPSKTISERYPRWSQERRFAIILLTLPDTLDPQGLLDWEQCWIDSTCIRASRAAARARKKGGPKTSPPIVP